MPHEEVVEAARVANAHEFIAESPDEKWKRAVAADNGEILRVVK